MIPINEYLLGKRRTLKENEKPIDDINDFFAGFGVKCVSPVDFDEFCTVRYEFSKEMHDFIKKAYEEDPSLGEKITRDMRNETEATSHNKVTISIKNDGATYAINLFDDETKYARVKDGCVQQLFISEKTPDGGSPVIMLVYLHTKGDIASADKELRLMLYALRSIFE